MKFIPVLFTLMILTSCASQKTEEQDIQEKVSKETTVSDPQTLGKSIHDLISSSKTLTTAQKAELEKIIAVNKQRASTLTEESFKFRSVLIKELLSGKLNQAEITLIKNDIKRIEAEKLKNTFETVEKITDIVSEHPEKEKFADHLIYMERPTH